jgi:hypothetical protein
MSLLVAEGHWGWWRERMTEDDLDPITLRAFLRRLNVGSPEALPLVHTTESSRIFKILKERQLLAAPCNVFAGENLTYFFVGRPSYKLKSSEPQSYYWQLPMVFVTKFDTSIKFKRILPFDSGAFKNARLPSHILNFPLDDYDLAEDPSLVRKLVAAFYGSNENYYRRKAFRPETLEDRHVLNPMHMEILSLAHLYSDPLTATSDDRSSNIEMQLEGNFQLADGNLLGLVLPREFSRAPSLVEAFRSMGCRVEYYDMFPLNPAQFYYAIYERVESILKKSGCL